MNGMLRNQRMWFAGLLGAALLAGSPIVAQADQGKWWDPQDRGPARERRVERNARDTRVVRERDRGVQRVYRQGGPRFQRQTVMIRDGRRGPRYNANRIWIRPSYIESRRLCVIRPVRYFVTAGAMIGGVHIRARIHDHDRFYYGCNFCDARFGGYGAYRAHVTHCDDRPRGYRFEISDWNEGWNSAACDVEGCQEHGGYHGGYDDNDYQDNNRDDYRGDYRDDYQGDYR